jgi:hypothetical protein
MAFTFPDRNPQTRPGMDTVGLMFLAATFLFPPFFLVGMVFLWLSHYWTLNEKLFGTLFPIGLFVVGWGVGLIQGGFAVPITAASIAGVAAAVIAAFALAFRSGLRDSRVATSA